MVFSFVFCFRRWRVGEEHHREADEVSWKIKTGNESSEKEAVFFFVITKVTFSKVH
jgi:hypothetical protein